MCVLVCGHSIDFAKVSLVCLKELAVRPVCPLPERVLLLAILEHLPVPTPATVQVSHVPVQTECVSLWSAPPSVEASVRIAPRPSPLPPLASSSHVCCAWWCCAFCVDAGVFTVTMCLNVPGRPQRYPPSKTRRTVRDRGPRSFDGSSSELSRLLQQFKPSLRKTSTSESKSSLF
jgi:hypothetical protein